MLPFAPLLFAASGCSEDERSIEGALEVLGANAPARVEVGSAVGRDRVAIPVTVVNELGVPVGGTTVDLAVSGECADGTAVVLEQSSVAIDASGHGLAHAIAPCSTGLAIASTHVTRGSSWETGNPSRTPISALRMSSLGLDHQHRFAITNSTDIPRSTLPSTRNRSAISMNSGIREAPDHVPRPYDSRMVMTDGRSTTGTCSSSMVSRKRRTALARPRIIAKIAARDRWIPRSSGLSAI